MLDSSGRASASAIEQTLDGDGDDGRTGPRPALELPPGATIGPYEIHARLGAGAMGVVYRAYDAALRRAVAVKVLHGDAADDKARRRLTSEAQAMARLQHRNVIGVHGLGEDEGRVYLAMELVEGQTLRQYLADTDLPWQQVVELFIAAGRGLSAAHRAGVVHRDFKPDNVMVSPTGQIKVTDFGLAMSPFDRDDLGPTEPHEVVDRETGDFAAEATGAAGRFAGTPAYMAPEQHLGHRVDARADQFALCASLYEAIVGHRPFPGETAGEIAAAVVENRFRRPRQRFGLPRWIIGILRRGLAREPDHRFESVDELLDALSTPAPPPKIWLWAGVAAALGSATATALYSLM